MIRKAVSADLDALADIENAAFSGNKLSRKSLRYMIANPKALMMVTEVMLPKTGDRVAGYGLILYRQNSSAARLYSFAVHPDFQGRGLSAGLLAALEAACTKPAIALEVRSDNHPAISFYTKMHYARAGTRGNYYEDGQSALVMRKTLAL